MKIIKNLLTIIFINLLFVSLIFILKTDTLTAETSCDYWTGGCKGHPLENPGQLGLSEATCMSICDGRTLCMSSPKGSPYGCVWTY